MFLFYLTEKRHITVYVGVSSFTHIPLYTVKLKIAITLTFLKTEYKGVLSGGARGAAHPIPKT